MIASAQITLDGLGSEAAKRNWYFNGSIVKVEDLPAGQIDKAITEPVVKVWFVEDSSKEVYLVFSGNDLTLGKTLESFVGYNMSISLTKNGEVNLLSITE